MTIDDTLTTLIIYLAIGIALGVLANIIFRVSRGWEPLIFVVAALGWGLIVFGLILGLLYWGAHSLVVINLPHESRQAMRTKRREQSLMRE